MSLHCWAVRNIDRSDVSETRTNASLRVENDWQERAAFYRLLMHRGNHVNIEAVCFGEKTRLDRGRKRKDEIQFSSVCVCPEAEDEMATSTLTNARFAVQ